MRVSDITYKSDISEFLLLENIDGFVQDLANNSKTIESEITSVLDTEIVSGGLDVYSLNINGESPAHDLAVDLVNNLCTVVDDLSEASKDIDKKAKDHRYNELTTLKKKLTTRIERIQKDISMKERLINSNNYFIENDNAKIAICQQEIANNALVTYTMADYQAFTNDVNERRNENSRLSSERVALVSELDGGFLSDGLRGKLEKVNIELSNLEAKM